MAAEIDDLSSGGLDRVIERMNSSFARSRLPSASIHSFRIDMEWWKFIESPLPPTRPDASDRSGEIETRYNNFAKIRPWMRSFSRENADQKGEKSPVTAWRPSAGRSIDAANSLPYSVSRTLSSAMKADFISSIADSTIRLYQPPELRISVVPGAFSFANF